MSNDKTNKFSLLEIPDLPPSVDNALHNLSDIPTKNIGNTLGDIWFLVFGGLSHEADKRRMKYASDLAEYKSEIEKSLSNIPPEKKLEPSLHITMQALESSKYCVEEKVLRSMFASLISNSMNMDTKKYVHPSFAEMIRQMSVLDAKIIQIFKNGYLSGFPICDYTMRASEDSRYSYHVLFQNAFLEAPDEDMFECSQSIESLRRLGLIDVPLGISLNMPEYYERFKSNDLFFSFQEKYPGKIISIQKKKASLTPLGRSFVRVCVPD